MNRHFHDARYYLGRAAEHAKLGVTEELAAVETAVRERTGYEEAPEPTTVERVRAAVEDPDRLVDEARHVATTARETLGEVRTGRGNAS